MMATHIHRAVAPRALRGAYRASSELVEVAVLKDAWLLNGLNRCLPRPKGAEFRRIVSCYNLRMATSKDAKREKEARLRALGLRPTDNRPQCVHCGQPMSEGAYGICQDCIGNRE
jgi:hypothetical protein